MPALSLQPYLLPLLIEIAPLQQTLLKLFSWPFMDSTFRAPVASWKCLILTANQRQRLCDSPPGRTLMDEDLLLKTIMGGPLRLFLTCTKKAAISQLPWCCRKPLSPVGHPSRRQARNALRKRTSWTCLRIQLSKYENRRDRGRSYGGDSSAV